MESPASSSPLFTNYFEAELNRTIFSIRGRFLLLLNKSYECLLLHVKYCSINHTTPHCLFWLQSEREGSLHDKCRLHPFEYFLIGIDSDTDTERKFKLSIALLSSEPE